MEITADPQGGGEGIEGEGGWLRDEEGKGSR